MNPLQRDESVLLAVVVFKFSKTLPACKRDIFLNKIFNFEYCCFGYILEKSKQFSFFLERLWQNVIATKRSPSSVSDMRCNDMLSMISVNIAAKFTLELFLNN